MRSASYKFATLLCLASCLVVAACVTINVYFPPRLAEKARRQDYRRRVGASGQPVCADRGRTNALSLPLHRQATCWWRLRIPC